MRGVLALLALLLALPAGAEPPFSHRPVLWGPLYALPLKLQVFPGSPVGGGGGGGGSSPPFSDATALVKGGTDATKLLRFEVDGFTTGNTRVMTPPNSNATLAGIDVAQTWTALQTIGSGLTMNADQALSFGTAGTATNRIQVRQEQTPDNAMFATGTTSNSWSMTEVGDVTTDLNNGPCAGAACTHPTLMGHGTTPTATSYVALSYAGLMRRSVKTLTESAATSTVQVPVAANTATGGVVYYTVFATDGTDQQGRSGFVRFSASNKAATETCGMTNNAGAADASITETEDGNAVAISSGTLTYAITCITTPANAIEIQINAVSSLTQSTLEAYTSVDLIGPGQILPQ